MRQLMLVTVLLGFLVSGTAIFLGDAFLAKPGSGEIASSQADNSSAVAGGGLGLMQWFAAAAARLNFGKGGATGPGFQPRRFAAGPSTAPGGPPEPFIPRAAGAPASTDRGDGLTAALRSPAFR